VGIVSRSQGGGGSGVGAVLFDSTLGANTASIDTGANGIAATQNVLEVWIVARTDDAAAVGAVAVTVNNDTGANYDLVQIVVSNATVTANNFLAQASWALNVPGAGALAGMAGVIALSIPAYAQTTFHKVGELRNHELDSVAANVRMTARGVNWRNTAAISRMKVAVSGGGTVLLAGSRLLILGR
jgi:hypothetical protein